MKKIGLLFVGISLFCIPMIQAQVINNAFSPPEKHAFSEDISIGAGLHYNFLAGDLISLQHEDDAVDFGFGLDISKQLSPSMTLGLEYLGYKLTGSDPDGFSEEFHFNVETNFALVGLYGKVYLNRFQEYFGRNPEKNIYIKVGYSFLNYDFKLTPRVDPYLEPAHGRFTGNESSAAYSFGFGLEKKINDRWYMDIAFNAYFADSDWLDGDPTLYLEVNDKNDAIYSGKFGIAYRLGSKRDKGYKWYNTFSERDAEINKLNLRIEENKTKIGSISQNGVEYKYKAPDNNSPEKKVDWADSDMDGVHDMDDLEPNTKKGALVNFQGKEIQAKVVATSTGEIGTITFNPVFFDFDTDRLDEKFNFTLATVAKYMKDNPDVQVVLVGHTDDIGDDTYNLNLSKRRVEEVKNRLTKGFNVDASRLIMDWKGESLQISTYHNINRRVDFILK